MNEDFLIHIGEYQDLNYNNFNDISKNTYHVDYIKWNSFFYFEKEKVDYLHKDKKNKYFIDNNSQDINEYREKIYDKYGNYDDNILTRINFRIIKRNRRKD
jgi:hypothetical protein